jgi:hypothetical protein
MHSQQYEELCRYFLANQLGIGVEDIRSVEIPNPRRPGLPKYKHQIDLYWETSDKVALYLNIANAKWRSSDKVDQPDVLLLQQVKQKVGAHKAVMLTSTGFTAGAKAAAQDEGIALHIVRPTFDYTVLPQKDVEAIQAKIQEIAASAPEPIYLHQVEYKAFDFTDTRLASTRPSSGYSTKIISGYSTKVVEGYSHKGSTAGGSEQGGPAIQRGGRETKAGGPGSQ